MICSICRTELIEESVIYTRSMIVLPNGTAGPGDIPVCTNCWYMDHPDQPPVRTWVKTIKAGANE